MTEGISPVEKREVVDFEHQITLPEINADQKGIEAVALPQLGSISAPDQVESKSFQAKAIDKESHATFQSVDRVFTKTVPPDASPEKRGGPAGRQRRPDFSPIVGSQYTLSARTVSKVFDFLTKVTIEKLEGRAEESRAERKKNDERQAVKRDREGVRERRRLVKDAYERKRAVLRGLRRYLKKEDSNDYRDFQRLVGELSQEDQVELKEAFLQMREDWRLFEGMSSLYEGRIEGELLGRNQRLRS